MQHVTEVRNHLLAMTKSSGMSLASFSFTASEIGPNMTTGLLKPAAKIKSDRALSYMLTKKTGLEFKNQQKAVADEDL